MEQDNHILFCGQLVRLNAAMKELFDSGNVELFAEMNAAIKEMYRIQHGSEDAALAAAEEDCNVIYQNFDMIVAVLRTTENGEIDAGAQKAINKFLHNIDAAVLNVAAVYGLV